jgi:DNA-binding winged helix-turn-helix (wHTH) protein
VDAHAASWRGEMSIAPRLKEKSPESRPSRRGRGEPARSIYERGRLRIDFDAYQVWADGRAVHLMRREFQLLRFFVHSANRVFDRMQILAQVWPRARVNPRMVDVHVYRLRRALERHPERPELFVTVRGVGWRFDERPLLEAHGPTDPDHADSRDRSPQHGFRRRLQPTTGGGKITCDGRDAADRC